MTKWYRGIAVGGAGSSPTDVHDLGPGTYFADTTEVAEIYATTRAGAFNQANERTTAMPAILYTEVPDAELGRVLDLTQGPDGARWNEFANEPLLGDLTRGKIMRQQPPKYGEYFREFLTRNNININEYSAYIGPEYLRGGKQLCVRNPQVASSIMGKMTGGRSIYAPPPTGHWDEPPPEVITVTPGRGQANASAMMGAFQAAGALVNWLNNRLQSDIAKAETTKAQGEIDRWQAANPADGALVSLLHASKELNDDSGVLRKSVFVQAGDTFMGLQIDYGPTYAQAWSHRRQIGQLRAELPENSPYKMEYRTSFYWVKPNASPGSMAPLMSPVGWWYVRVKPSFQWYYEFRANHTIFWMDPGTSKMGEGTWKETPSFINIQWASGSSEKWTRPLAREAQAGQCMWSNGIQDVRADFGVTPPSNVLNPPPNSPAGTWNVLIGNSRFRYVYRFDQWNNVSWTDIFDKSQTGKGRWKFADDYLVITWSSGSKEHWDTPLDPKGQTGTAQISGEGTMDLKATRA